MASRWSGLAPALTWCSRPATQQNATEPCLGVLVAGGLLLTLLGCCAPQPTPDIPATVESEVGQRVLARMVVVPATVTAQVAATVEAQVAATLEAAPTATAYPTYTLFPTATLSPTFTPTPLPTPTATPEPTPTPAVRWGLENNPVSIRDDFPVHGNPPKGDFVMRGCSTGEWDIGRRRSLLFSGDGQFGESSKFVLVSGFPVHHFWGPGLCYDMGVKFVGVSWYCYGHTLFGGPVSDGRFCSGWKRLTPIYELVSDGAWERSCEVNRAYPGISCP